MKINVDINKDEKYNKRHLVKSLSGRNYYPSKKMFAEFLKQYKDVPGEVDIWSIDDHDKGVTTIKVALTYKPKPIKAKNAKRKKAKVV